MKKLIVFLGVVLLSSCGCILPQVVPQKVYATATNCSAPIPNYLPLFTANDNCEIASIIQTPVAGTMLTPINKVATVTVKATDGSGNFKQVVFTVTLLDTIKPTFTIAPSLLSYQVNQINDIYTFADKLVGGQDANLMKQTWIDSIPGLRAKLQDSAYYKKTLVVSSFWKPDGTRPRVIAFADTVRLITNR
jgi:hypothetical protein